MALYRSYTFTTIEQLIADWAAFAVENGWTITNQAATTITVAKNGHAFTVIRTGPTTANMQAIPSGGTVNTTTVTIATPAVGAAYMFVSTGRGLLYGYADSNGSWGWGGLVFLDLITTQTGGLGLCPAVAQKHLGRENAGPIFYLNGAWTPTSGAGSVVGLIESSLGLASKMPVTFNAGIMPFPIVHAQTHTTTTYFRPIGQLENIYRIGGGTVYVHGDTVVIGGDTYLAVAYVTAAIGDSGSRDLLIKLAA